MKMYISETSGLASYQQTVYQTPGLASSIWPQSTSIRVPIVVQIVPTNYDNQEEESLEQKTAQDP